ncbi:twin-arginine translocation signal domain-containing protein [Bradyrhizobium manausense]|nr:twin-arginine translocation signal domain-containing protein [Bradyrhizobium manausense]MBR0685708.1 twin-arginine translocation signal domain-containing protein [Bradyrhizobium manausense]MBR0723204.1 twin-arginine translocation signal domain-containing protein [Bradyrhizobium manausense]MBR0837204.1 twin-arginine translocation signal domain-containing protein [Bradyrhizobium manausense]
MQRRDFLKLSVGTAAAAAFDRFYKLGLKPIVVRDIV